MKEDYIVHLKPKKTFRVELKILGLVEMSVSEKKKLVERGLKEFNVNPKFRELLSWILDESNKIHQKKMKEIIKKIKDEMTNHDHDPDNLTSYCAGLRWVLEDCMKEL